MHKLIKQETGLEMPIRTVDEYLKRWGFTPQKPVKFAYERKPEMVKKWLDGTSFATLSMGFCGCNFVE